MNKERRKHQRNEANVYNGTHFTDEDFYHFQLCRMPQPKTDKFSIVKIEFRKDFGEDILFPIEMKFNRLKMFRTTYYFASIYSLEQVPLTHKIFEWKIKYQKNALKYARCQFDAQRKHTVNEMWLKFN